MPPIPAGVKIQGIDPAVLDKDIVRVRDNSIGTLNGARDIVLKLFTGVPVADQTIFKTNVAATITTYTAAVAVVQGDVAKVSLTDYASLLKTMKKARLDLYNARVVAVDGYNNNVRTIGEAYHLAHLK